MLDLLECLCPDFRDAIIGIEVPDRGYRQQLLHSQFYAIKVKKTLKLYSNNWILRVQT